jgi:hypothetical protein
LFCLCCNTNGSVLRLVTDVFPHKIKFCPVFSKVSPNSSCSTPKIVHRNKSRACRIRVSTRIQFPVWRRNISTSRQNDPFTHTEALSMFEHYLLLYRPAKNWTCVVVRRYPKILQNSKPQRIRPVAPPPCTVLFPFFVFCIYLQIVLFTFFVLPP